MTVALDSNVLIAASVPEHAAAAEARAVLDALARPMVALHSLSEVYNTLTKPTPYGAAPVLAARIIDRFADLCEIVELPRGRHLAGIGTFADLGGVGARLYDYLIGVTVIDAGAEALVSLNVKHFIPLFPTLTILTPTQYLETL